MSETTFFGFKQVPLSDKVKNVQEVFTSVANHYDIMNDLMSLGLHRIWKKIAIRHCQLKHNQCILDCAGGTGDLSKTIMQSADYNVDIILADINFNMLQVGRDKLLDVGIHNRIQFTVCDAECLSFPDHYFDRIIIGFGLRNVTNIEKALTSMYRCLKPGGKLIILEFSKANPIISKIYDYYSFNVIPKIGHLVANDKESYQYLVESIRKHPDQYILKNMMESIGFDGCYYQNLAAGIVAIHAGYKC